MPDRRSELLEDQFAGCGCDNGPVTLLVLGYGYMVNAGGQPMRHH